MRFPAPPQLLGRISAAGMVFLFGGNIALYLFSAGLWSVPPFAFVLALGGAAVLLLLSRAERQAVQRWPMAFWCIGYIVLNTVYFLVSTQSSEVLVEFSSRLMSAGYLLVGLLIFAMPSARRVAAQSFGFVLVIALVLNVVDIVLPNTFSIVLGRAAGLYLNPNIAAGALIGVMVVLIASFPKQRMLWLAAGSLAVLLTLSRGGLVSWALVVVALVGQGTIPMRRALRWLVVLLAMMTVAGMAGYLDPLVGTFTGSSAFASRMAAFGAASSSTDLGDVSIPMRLQAARAAWALFEAHPFVGAGIGATTEWALNIYPHNIYLRHLAEHGALGILVYPLFVLAATWRCPRAARLPLILFLSALGLFDHNVLDNRALLTIVAFASAWPAPVPLVRSAANATGPAAPDLAGGIRG